MLCVLFSDFCKEVSVIGATTGFRDAEKEFYLSSYPAAQRAMKRLLAQLASDITSVVHTGNKAAWEISETKNNALLQQVGRNITLPKHLQERVKQSSVNALAAFEERKVNGMNLSKRVWNLVQPLQGQMELALELGLSDGKGAASLSRDVRQYLLNPDKLFRRVRDKDGILRLSKAAAAYHPGQGVYRSSYKNALRMTVTENNMAYRSADYAQWEEMPFVIGTEIGLSNNHPIYDICDELSGVYPKDFKFVGWHPFCRCFATPKLADRNEVNKWARMTDEERKGYKFKGTVETLPKQFNTWVDKNKERIARAKILPYFLKDNKEIIERAAKIEEHKTLYNRYRNDNNYKDVAFNKVSGGLMATHIEHNIDKNKGWYETTVQKIGYDAGNIVILEKEDHTVQNKKNTEGKWNGMLMEIAGAETGTANNIRNALKHCASKIDTEIAIVFMPDYSPVYDILGGIDKFEGLKKNGGSQWKKFAQIIFMSKEKIIKTYRQE